MTFAPEKNPGKNPEGKKEAYASKMLRYVQGDLREAMKALQDGQKPEMVLEDFKKKFTQVAGKELYTAISSHLMEQARTSGNAQELKFLRQAFETVDISDEGIRKHRVQSGQEAPPEGTKLH